MKVEAVKRVRFEHYNPNIERKNWKVYSEYVLISKDDANKLGFTEDDNARDSLFLMEIPKALPEIERYGVKNREHFFGACNECSKIEDVVMKWRYLDLFVLKLEDMSYKGLNFDVIDSETPDRIIISVLKNDESLIL